jgi:heterodisulfide reductase subunit B
VTDTPTSISSDLARRVDEELGQNVSLCYQCVRCTSGCPISEFFDWQPNQIMRAVQLGQEDIALHAETPWLCASCQTCTTHCPQGLDVAGIMDFLTREAMEQGVKPPVPEADAFNSAFLREIRMWRRAYELGMLAELKLKTGHLTEDLDLGLKMIRKGRFSFLPHRARRRDKVRPIEGADGAVAYYPGCSLTSTAEEFDRSTRAVCDALGVRIIEPKGWACCGGSVAHRADPEQAISLPLENLSLIERSGFSEVTMPCVACFSRHKFAQADERGEGSAPESAEPAVRVSSLLDTILDHVGTDQVAAGVQRPLTDLRVVCYYGCLLTRPPDVTGAERPEDPIEMDVLMAALGAQVLDWSYKTSCCGAVHSLIRKEIVLKLGGDLIEHARAAGAEVIAVACPLCHANLDARQTQMEIDRPMPVLYFTQLMAIALGLPPRVAALDKNLIDPRPILKEKALID